MKPLSADQLTTSIGIATGHFESLRTKFEREKNNRNVDEVTAALARAFYWRERDVQEFANRFRVGGEGFEANAGQALFLTYNGLLQNQLQQGQDRLVQELSRLEDNGEAARIAFLTVLSRLPTDVEKIQSVSFLSGNEPSRPTRCGELIWALLCSGEFRFNH